NFATSTRRVGTVLYKAKAPFRELIEVDFRNGEHKAPSYIAKQPFWLMPYIMSLN
ncbi:hypothetical protein FB451DRAFT_1030567, partial [Mycena latifolia]